MNKSPKVGKATKPRTVYEKAVQDFTETARRLARLNQHFRQASFAEFEMLMGLDDEVLNFTLRWWEKVLWLLTSRCVTEFNPLC